MNNIETDNEIWKSVEGFEEYYEISNSGKIKSIGKYNTCKKGLLKPMTDRCGYKHVQLYSRNNQKFKNISIHRLVALYFVPNPNNYKYVNHIDKNVENNNWTNLEWCTNSYNIAYSRGVKVKQYTKNNEFVKTHMSITEAARELNSYHDTIKRVIKNKSIYKNYILTYE